MMIKRESVLTCELALEAGGAPARLGCLRAAAHGAARIPPAHQAFGVECMRALHAQYARYALVHTFCTQTTRMRLMGISKQYYCSCTLVFIETALRT